MDLKLSKKAMETVHVLLPENVQDICSRTDLKKVHVTGRCGHGCENMDSFAVARQQYKKFSHMLRKDTKPVLVLNLANPVHPGGGVRRGARAQEEDLCRKSSLLLSLESRHAVKYYEYNRNLNSYMGSDAMMFTPEVEIIRDKNGNLLEETVIVAVLTCAAFGNDAHVISDLFYAAVNHRGDSDSTGAVTGNILGALLGYEAIKEKWKSELELADDLCHGCQMNEYSHYEDSDWIRKYMHIAYAVERRAA